MLMYMPPRSQIVTISPDGRYAIVQVRQPAERSSGEVMPGDRIAMLRLSDMRMWLLAIAARGYG
ncbi:MAG: hypothetical protein A2Z18_09825 [Armatimonadetes bacterium RBG_16_58_9]|nr:MAG: hypothetical protein A2Z18_09825 [Armatimonadetes bacterium RBG_16_58_9]